MSRKQRAERSKPTPERPLDNRAFGPLTGPEWVELDGWVFEGVPEEVYKLFERLWRHHDVPLDQWLSTKSPRR